MGGYSNDPRYSPNKKGELMQDVWQIPSINNMAKERTGYPTQKPLTLLERIIKSSSKGCYFRSILWMRYHLYSKKNSIENG